MLNTTSGSLLPLKIFKTKYTMPSNNESFILQIFSKDKEYVCLVKTLYILHLWQLKKKSICLFRDMKNNYNLEMCIFWVFSVITVTAS